jgi:hypothetical protein
MNKDVFNVPSMYKQESVSSIEDGNPDNTPRYSGKKSAGKGMFLG